jgi:hypothetical protein
MYRISYSLPFVLALATSAAHAQPQGVYEQQPVAAKHRGIFLRVTPGIAGSAARANVDGNELMLSGGAGRFGLSVGWSVMPRLIVAAEVLGHAVLGPDLETQGTVTTTDEDVVWGVSYLGGGINYYLPNNLYFAASAGTLMMSLETDMKMAETEIGFGMKVGAGYEWFVTPKVGLGVGLEVLGGSVNDAGTDWTIATVGLAFSATYN